MITAIVTVLGWVAKHIYFVVKWFGPAIAKLISNWWVIAGLTIFAISSWALADWNGICNAVSQYFDMCTNAIRSFQITTGVQWIDGFIGFFALDSFVSYLVGFLAFFLPVVSTVIIGVFVSIVGFAIKLIVYKITTASTRDLGR